MAKKGRGQAKGSGFERDICKQLSLWWTGQKRDDIFWRTAGSGGRATNRFKQGKTTTAGAYGDLTYLDPIGKPLLDLVCFELKRGYKWELLDLLDKRAGTKPCMFAEFWGQAKTSAKQASVPFCSVIFKRDGKQVCIALKKAMFAKIGRDILKPVRYMVCKVNKEQIIVMRLEDFFENVSPKLIKRLARYYESK